VEDITVSEHITLLESIISEHIDAKLEVVSDIATWCADNSGGMYKKEELDNPIAKSLYNSDTEPDRILIRNNISGDKIEDILLSMHIKSFTNVYYAIDNSVDFLIHLVLHEVAHIKHDWRQSKENDCDKWAFQQLELIKNTSKQYQHYHRDNQD
jgi:hypothetical protein